MLVRLEAKLVDEKKAEASAQNSSHDCLHEVQGILSQEPSKDGILVGWSGGAAWHRAFDTGGRELAARLSCGVCPTLWWAALFLVFTRGVLFREQAWHQELWDRESLPRVSVGAQSSCAGRPEKFGGHGVEGRDACRHWLCC